MLKKSFLIICCLLCACTALSAHVRPSTIAFQRAWDRYSCEVVSGAPPAARMALLDRIIKRFSGKRGVDLTHALDEREYLGSWDYYLKQKASGASLNDRLYIVERILDKYALAGVDLTPVLAEQTALNARLAPPPAVSTATVTAPPAVISTTTAVSVSSPTPVAPAVSIAEPPPAPLKKDAPPQAVQPEKRYAKYFGIAVRGLGAYGTYGYDAVINVTDRLSCTAGYGRNILLPTPPNSLSTNSQTTYSFLARYGDNVYAGTGFQKRVTSGDLVAGTVHATQELTNYGIPLVIGVETGRKRGIFFSVELAYIPYFGSPSTTLGLSNPAGGENLTLKLEAPTTGFSFGLGFGFYLF